MEKCILFQWIFLKKIGNSYGDEGDYDFYYLKNDKKIRSEYGRISMYSIEQELGLRLNSKAIE